MPKLLYRSKLPRPDDPEIVETICRALSRGHPLSTAAALAGICDQTLYDWKTEGLRQLAAAGEHPPWRELGSHARLVVYMKEAEAGLVDEVLDHVRAGGTDWAAWMTLAERRRPHDFGRYNRVEVQQQTTVTVRLELSLEDREALLTLARRDLPQLVEGEVMSSENEAEESDITDALLDTVYPASP